MAVLLALASGGADRRGSRGLRVPLGVQRQVVGAREAPLAVAAAERLGARVLAVVPRELVRAREPPLAPLPRALVRLLASMRPLMRFEMRALSVDFIACGKFAAMHASAGISRVRVRVVTSHVDLPRHHVRHWHWTRSLFPRFIGVALRLTLHGGDEREGRGGLW